MKRLLTSNVGAILVLYTSLVPATHADLADRVEFSGFARLVSGYLDTNKASYEGYSNSLSFSQQSLVALQSDITLSDTVSVSAQLLGHTGNKRESGLEWMYFSYQPSQHWQFKIGKLRTPFFRYSDVVDVGFAYPWISPPQQVYSAFLFSNYEGLSSSYSNSIGPFNVEIEGYYGSYDGDIKTPSGKVLFKDEIVGLIFNINKGNFNARVSSIQSSDLNADVPGFAELAAALDQAGFPKNADSLRFDQGAKAYQANINYDTLDYFVAAEWVKITSKVLAVPNLDAYYVTAGYNFAPFQAHITYSVSRGSYSIEENTIPVGVSANLDQLSFTYDRIVEALPLDELDAVTLGLRWDFQHNFAAKAEITFLNGKLNQNSFYSSITDASFNREATLYQIGVEWVF